MRISKKAFWAPVCLILLGFSIVTAAKMHEPQRRQYLFGQATFLGPESPSFVASGDFNRDGKPDFALADPEDNTVSVLLGRPDGTFDPPVSFPTGPMPGYIAVGDFKKDGKLDLAVAYGGTGTCCGGVSILLGKGDGSFRSHVDISLSGVPVGIVTGDFNGDGHLDLAVLTQDSSGNGTSQVFVLLGNGNGTFRSPIVSLASLQASDLVVADFNGDGKLDLATTMFKFVDEFGDTANVSILLGNGDGSFQSPNEIAFTGETFPYGLAAGDFNGDHKIDLALGASFEGEGAPNGVAILAGNGDGTFTSGRPVPFNSNVSPRGLIAADLNGDGKLDVAAYAQNTVDVLLGNGNGSLGSATEFGIGNGTLAGIVADVNGDFKPDLVLAATGGLNVVLGNGVGGFSSKTTYTASNTPLGLTTGDFNGNEHPDIVFANADNDTISLLVNSGDGTFTSSPPFATGSRPDSIAAGDFNGDGNLDVAVANMEGNSVSVLLGDGDGSFRPKTDYPAGESPVQVIAADFNGDGKLDLAVANNGVLLQGGSVSILLGNGDGTFQPQQTVALSATGPVALAAADFNHDGKIDLAVAFQGSPAVSILLGNGDGTFQPFASYTLPATAASLVAADFNGDGNTDLASGSVILLGNGDGTFTTGQTLAGFSLALAADFNSDHILDLLAGASFNTGTVLLGSGDGTFQFASNLSTGESTTGLTSADFNSDGALDFAAENSLAYGVPGNVTVFLSTPVAAIGPALPNSSPHADVRQGRARKFLLLSNPSPAPLSDISVSLTGSGSVHDTCSARLSPGESCLIIVDYIQGPLATLVISDDAPGSPQIIPLDAVAAP